MNTGMIKTKMVRAGLLLSAICFLGMAAMGCDSDDGEGPDEGRVRICNSDDVAYGVEVVARAEDEVVDNFSVGGGSPSASTCEESGKIDVGAHYVRFYLTDGTLFKRSPDFTVAEEDESAMAAVYMTRSGEVGVIDADPEGEGDIFVCNRDDEDYIVELRMEEDGRLVDSFEVKMFLNVADVCDQFKDVDAGVYYIRIIEEDNRNTTDRSVSFFLEDDEVEEFEIDTTGSILKTTD
jgi:hypothetical protein